MHQNNYQYRNYFLIKSLDLIKFNLKLAAQSGILVAMYRKAIEGDLNLIDMTILIETIAQHMNT